MIDKKSSEVAALVASVLNLPVTSVGPTASSQTLPQWDSLAHLRICMAFQEKYSVEMGMETIAEATSVSKLAQLIP